MNKGNNTIFIQLASYRDPQLVPTIDDLLVNAQFPENLTICVAHQYCEEDEWHKDIDKYRDDKRFIIMDIPYLESQGACWARNYIQQQYDGEKYTLQLDSHHRFVVGWDTLLINMVKKLQKIGHAKPLLTSYISSFDPEKDPEMRVQEPWWMTFDRFIPEGAVFFLPSTIPNWQNLHLPVPSRFYSAHFCFTLGEFCLEVQHDPKFYFHGEEISIAVRAFTWGYDLFHPHRVIAWHEYTRKGRPKQWDDDKQWGERNRIAHYRNRILLGIEGDCAPCAMKQLEPYGLGPFRTIADYEKFTGIRFKDKSVQQYTLDNNLAPNPIIYDPEEYENSFQCVYKHCIDVGYDRVPEEDYDLWALSIHDEQDTEIFRRDIQEDEIRRMKTDPDQYCKVWVQFHYKGKPARWKIWLHSKSKDWTEQLEGSL